MKVQLLIIIAGLIKVSLVFIIPLILIYFWGVVLSYQNIRQRIPLIATVSIVLLVSQQRHLICS